MWGDEQQDSFDSLKRALSEAPVLQIPEQQDSFDSLKRALSEAPVLQIPDFEKECVSYRC
jgi:hypothetical protein